MTETIDNIPYRPLGLVKEMLELIGQEVSYVYEDLIFMTHNHFLLQFGKVGEILFYYVNDEIQPEQGEAHFKAMVPIAAEKGLRLIDQGKYSYSEQEGEAIGLELLPREKPAV